MTDAPPRHRGLAPEPALRPTDGARKAGAPPGRGALPARLGLLLLLLLPTPWAHAAAADAQRVVITASPVARAAADAPYAVTVVDAQALRAAGPMVHLSEALARVPGLAVRNRSNYAQDLQLSSRGFGARAGFGVRGLRLYSDGIPATMPDGQGQVAHFDLAGADRVEVLRGPFSVLHGNSSGGVLAVFSAPVRRPRLELGLDAAGDGLRQLRAAWALPLSGNAAEAGRGPALRGGVSHLEAPGWRPHSQARRTLAHGALDWQGSRDRLLLQVGLFDQPAQDPLGLTPAQFAASPDQTTPQAPQFDTRKTARQQQAGAAWTRRLDEGALREIQLAAYAGRRHVVQWLAIAPATQANPRHGGGVIDLDRSYRGVDLRTRFDLGALALVAGVAAEDQDDERRGYENFLGSGPGQRLGVTGALRRDERNRAATRDVYAQLEWPLAADLLLSAGLRSGRVSLQAQDRYLANGDDSGRLVFSHSQPVLGFRLSLAPGLHLFASAARGFESPTLGELAYRPDGAGGFNTALRPQTSLQSEAGLKWRAGPHALDLTVFDVLTRQEIGVASNAGGRSSFQNVGGTRRRGLELSGSLALAAAWRFEGAFSSLDARHLNGFLACAGLPCTAPSVPVPAGNRVAGTQRVSAWGSLAWEGHGREAAIEWRAAGRIVANDVNTVDAPGHGTLALRLTQGLDLGGNWRGELLLRVDNLTERRHVGSVIVNEASGRFLEPAPPRTWLLAWRLRTGG